MSAGCPSDQQHQRGDHGQQPIGYEQGAWIILTQIARQNARQTSGAASVREDHRERGLRLKQKFATDLHQYVLGLWP